MPIVAADLKGWLSVNNPQDDVSTSGGAIQDDSHASGGIRFEFQDIAAVDTVQVLSDGADTRQVAITGRLASGAIATETLTLNGATAVTSTNSYERILKAVLSAKDAARSVTLRRTTGATTIATLGINVIAVRRLFYDAASQATQISRYECLYLKNGHGSLSLNSAMVTLTADPGLVLKIAVYSSKGDVASIANRVTLPSGTFVDDNVAQSVPTGAMAFGERIGVWVQQTLGINAPPVKASFTVQLSGTTV